MEEKRAYDLIEKVIAELQNYCDEEMLTVTVTHGDSFAWYNGTPIIKINFLEDFQSDLFMKNAKKQGLEKDMGHFLTAFFHEIGHYYTDNWLTKAEAKQCDKIKKKLNGEKEEDNFIYFTTYDEKIATDWAIDYINENYEKLNKLLDKINPLIDEMDLEELLEIYSDMEEEDLEMGDILALLFMED